jgi:V-type H+-transporting ATPase subunit d
MSIALFNSDHGYTEALIRGFRSTFLKTQHYMSLEECSTLAGVNSVLQETDYGEIMPRIILTDKPSSGGGESGAPAAAAAAAAADGEGGDGAQFNHTKLKRLVLEKAATEFRMLRTHAVEPLATFMDLVTHEYMIDMIVSVMQAVNACEGGESISAVVEEVRKAADAAHPLGRLDPGTETAIAGFSASASELVELVRSLLVETPVGRYFETFLLELLSPEDLGRDADLAAALKEQPLYLLEHATKRIWLEYLHNWCAKIGGETAERMCTALEDRASLLAISLADNSLTDGIVSDDARPEILRACFPSIGELHPSGLHRLAMVRSQTDIEAVLMDYPKLYALWRACPVESHGYSKGGFSESSSRSIAVTFRKHMAAVHGDLFQSQFHFGPFYAYVKLKDEEAANMQLVADHVAAREARARSEGGPRTGATPAGEVAAAVSALIIPMEAVSPADIDQGGEATTKYGAI